MIFKIPSNSSLSRSVLERFRFSSKIVAPVGFYLLLCARGTALLAGFRWLSRKFNLDIVAACLKRLYREMWASSPGQQMVLILLNLLLDASGSLLQWYQ